MVGPRRPHFEPTSMHELKYDASAYEVFKLAHYDVYFKRLWGYDEKIALEFAQGFQKK